jgi:hypothetical protein
MSDEQTFRLGQWFKTFNRFAPFNRRAARLRSKRFERLERLERLERERSDFPGGLCRSMIR